MSQNETLAQYPPPIANALTRLEAALEEALTNISTLNEAQAVRDELLASVAQKPAVEVAEVPAVDFNEAKLAQLPALADELDDIRRNTPDETEQAAAILERVTEEAIALEGPAYALLTEVVQNVLPPDPDESDPEVREGRRKLRQTILNHPSLSYVKKKDAELFIAINNNVPRPKLFDVLFKQLSFWFNGGWGWLILVVLMWPWRGKKTLETLKHITIPIWVAGLSVEGPVKKYFRRRRPFIDLVRTVVVGKKPGNWSFPSGHSATAFAGAQMMSRYFPRWRSLWYTIASLIAFSRIYLGAHYPGDVLTGSLTGLILAEWTHTLQQKSSSNE